MKRFQLRCSVQLLLIKDNKILLLRRFNTGWMDGRYGLVAGHLDGGEEIKKAMIREAKEEAGIDLHEDDLMVVHTMHRISDGVTEYIDFFLTAKKWKGTPKVAEPDRSDEVTWFSLDSLPSGVMGHIKQAIENHKNNIGFSVFGFHGEKY